MRNLTLSMHLALVLTAGLLGSLVQSSVADAAEVRLALVVGTSDYPGAFRLPNPERDAEAIAKALSKGGFFTPASVAAKAAVRTPADPGVSAVLNPSRETLVRAILMLKAEADTAGARGDDVTVLFYFAGHGVQFNGVNYLIPAGTSLFGAEDPGEADYKTQTVTAQDEVLDELTQSRARRVIVVLDACRTNPFKPDARGLKSADGGLAAMRPPTGSAAMIFYASEPRRPAIDAVAGALNSPFTQALDAFLDIPGLKAGEVFARVHDRVSIITKGAQNPYFEGAPLFDFEFYPDAPASLILASTQGPAVLPEPVVPSAPAKSSGGESNLNIDARVILKAVLRKSTIAQVKQLAEDGEAFSQWMLALAYMDGIEVQKDGVQARNWARSAVSKGLSRATVTLGYLHQNGIGGPASPSEAVGWYQVGVNAGETAAKGALGWYYLTGSGGVAKDLVRARELFSQAAAEGQPYAREIMERYFAQ